MKWMYKRSWRSSIYHFCNKSKVAKEVFLKIEPILHRPLLCASNHCECTIHKTHKSWQNIINNKPCWRICNQHKPEQQETISPIQIINQKRWVQPIWSLVWPIWPTLHVTHITHTKKMTATTDQSVQAQGASCLEYEPTIPTRWDIFCTKSPPA